MISLQKYPVIMARTELGLSYVKIAREAGLNVDTVSAAEKSGQKNASINRSTAAVILSVLNRYRAVKNLPALEVDDLDWKIRGQIS